MKKLNFKVTLQSDVIINMKSATEGSQRSLDFIPGNVFLGIVASRLYAKLMKQADNEKAFELFHSGAVRFGDAHLSIESRVRGLKIPASLFYPKLNVNGQHIVHHLYSYDKHKKDKGSDVPQWKQCREGYYIFDEIDQDKLIKPEKLELSKNYAIKSAHDRTTRTSKEGQMYGYESLPKGKLLFFSVEMDNEVYADDIRNALVGLQQVGRSRSAQYGLVDVQECKDVKEIVSNKALDARILYYNNSEDYKELNKKIDQTHFSTVYADGRLIFTDPETGQCTFKPTVEQLGFDDDAEILWNATQIRTFQYAPWNGKRMTYDMDRCGIEKGSVFVVAHNESLDVASLPSYIGSFNQEGFGKVIYNPSFLKCKKESNGESIIDFTPFSKGETLDSKKVEEKDYSDELTNNSAFLYADAYKKYKNIESQLGAYLSKNIQDRSDILIQTIAERRKADALDTFVYDIVKVFVDKKSKDFNGAKFPSQWGTIRSMALADVENKSIQEDILNYIKHGVKKTDWNYSRTQALDDFMTLAKQTSVLRLAIINLASEMAKKSK